MNSIPDKFSVLAAIATKKDTDLIYYRSFGIKPDICFMWGEERKNIVSLQVGLHEDQSSSDTKSKSEPDYWGYWDIQESKFTFIYPSWIQLYMCFPYGIKILEEQGKGKAYRLQVLTSIPLF